MWHILQKVPFTPASFRLRKQRIKRENEPVMKEKKPLRDRWLTIRLSKKEESILLELAKKTTCQSLSEYGRHVLLKEPVIVRYRNASADDFLEEMVLLKKELNAIGNNFNQAVHRLHTLDKTEEIKLWLRMSESQRAILLKKTSDILQKVAQIHVVWLQK
jgi:predicted GNAT family acetyltransferase